MCNVELYAIVHALSFWRHYLISKEFVLYFHHESLKHLNDQQKISAQHTRLINFLQEHTFSIKHKAEIHNKVARHFESSSFPTFLHVYRCSYLFVDGFLFKGNCLYIPESSLYLLVIKEARMWDTLERTTHAHLA